MDKIPIILLAAGGSKRMGQPKQLLPWENSTLIEYQIKKLLQTGNPLIIVLGSSAKEIISVIEKYQVKIASNTNWETGMGSSVATGMQKVIEEFPSAKGVLFSLIDQPLIMLEHIQKMLVSFNSGNQQIIASQAENGWLGVPALYDAFYFDELRKLSGEQGAKTIIKKYPSKVSSVDAGDTLEDMDTLESYHKLLSKYLKSNLSN